LEPGSAFYNIPAAVRLRGPLHVAALEHSFNEIINRHEALRTSFVTVEGRPAQVIAPLISLTLTVNDLRQMQENQREVEVERMVFEEARLPFDLTTAPLMRVSLLQLEEQEHVLLVTLHHIISDGWSINILMREIAALYEAFSHQAPSPLVPLSIQYGDYAAWQREWLSEAVLTEQLGYWRETLAGAPPLLELPTDRPRPAVQSYEGARRSLTLSSSVYESLKALSHREEVTLFTTLLAAFQVLLSRYSGQQDIVVGTPVAGRQRLEIEGLIGFFVNTLVLRTQLSNNPTFRELATQVMNTALEAQAHQDVPFEKLVEALQPARDMSRSPLFQVMFVLQNAATDGLEIPGLSSSQLEVESGTAKFDLTLFVTEQPQGLACSLEYNTDLFEAATADRLLESFQVLLDSIVANPEQHISSLQILTPAQQHQQVEQWNQTQSDFPAHLCLHQFFEQQVVRSPDALALISQDAQFSYRKLNERANQLAHHLLSLGVGPESIIGICLERSPLLLISLLAVLKAGAAYLPLDHTYPAARLSFMLEDAEVQILLTESELQASIPATEHLTVLSLDLLDTTLASYSVENAKTQVEPQNLAYVIYTSGSTGTPKGVCVSHRAVARLVKQTNYADFSSDEVFLQLAPVTFDASTFEIWGALLNGARLVQMPPGIPLPEEIGAAVRQHHVTTLWLTAGLFHLMVDHHLDDLRGLRHLLAGGDVLDIKHVERFVNEASECRLTNGYGPTENTTFTCCHRVRQGEGGASVPIGRPISNTRVYILDEQLEPVGIGIVGELYTGGEGLARGYLKRAELTAEKFIPDPFAAGHGTGGGGGRLYRTGDLARYLEDGEIEYLGRADSQVKLRGYRIELGEIESQLRQLEGVQAAAVIVREGQGGAGRQLVGYVVGAEGAELSRASVREELRGRVPEYMIPQVLVLLTEMPLTQNGKVDRKRLGAGAESEAEDGREFEGARTEVEAEVVQIWREVLGIERVGIRDNFFELGGHSLLATQVMYSLRERFKVELPLRIIFETPTVAELSEAIDKVKGVSSEVIAPLARDRYRVKMLARDVVTLPQPLRKEQDA
jgi:aspartate racemase